MPSSDRDTDPSPAAVSKSPVTRDLSCHGPPVICFLDLNRRWSAKGTVLGSFWMSPGRHHWTKQTSTPDDKRGAQKRARRSPQRNSCVVAGGGTIVVRAARQSSAAIRDKRRDSGSRSRRVPLELGAFRRSGIVLFRCWIA